MIIGNVIQFGTFNCSPSMTAAQSVAIARFALDGGKELSISSSQFEDVPFKYRA
jgi:hypothetical protein